MCFLDVLSSINHLLGLVSCQTYWADHLHYWCQPSFTIISCIVSAVNKEKIIFLISEVKPTYTIIRFKFFCCASNCEDSNNREELSKQRQTLMCSEDVDSAKLKMFSLRERVGSWQSPDRRSPITHFTLEGSCCVRYHNSEQT